MVTGSLLVAKARESPLLGVIGRHDVLVNVSLNGEDIAREANRKPLH
jgi:hypothetical protein